MKFLIFSIWCHIDVRKGKKEKDVYCLSHSRKINIFWDISELIPFRNKRQNIHPKQLGTIVSKILIQSHNHKPGTSLQSNHEQK